MEVINKTPVVADLQVSSIEGTDRRYGLLTAKATYTVDERGHLELDSEAPYPLFEEDSPTVLGVFPSDAVPRRDPAFEVMVLGSVHGNGKSQVQVELSVGSVRRSLLVTGDRHWIGAGEAARISDPVPFNHLPLNWTRAYGGAVACSIDADSILDLEHPMNKYGRGFDAHKFAADVGQAFKAPPGYPRLPPGWRRRLPNLEHPARPIRAWGDDPRPYCWAPIPLDAGVHLQRAHDHMAATGQGMDEEAMLEMVYHRAHPDWIIPVPDEEAPVILKGMSKQPWRFSLPRLHIAADWAIGTKKGIHHLAPQVLMLLPEESRFYLVYRHFFTMQTAPEVERSVRIRTEKGWKR